MDVTDRLIAAAKCVRTIGLADTVRAMVNRSTSRFAATLFGDEMAFRPSRSDPRKVFLRTGTADWIIFNQIFVRREYDLSRFPQWEEVVTRYRDILDQGETPTIIDCGANVGLSSIWFSLQFPAARIIAVEMEAENFLRLQRNLEAFPNVKPIHAAVWGEVTALRMRDQHAAAHAFSATLAIEDSAEQETMTSLTVRDIIANEKVNHLFCVKLDIEGAEASVLDHDVGWIDGLALLVLELHDGETPGQGCGQAFVKALNGREFDLLQSGELIAAVLR